MKKEGGEQKGEQNWRLETLLTSLCGCAKGDRGLPVGSSDTPSRETAGMVLLRTSMATSSNEGCRCSDAMLLVVGLSDSSEHTRRYTAPRESSTWRSWWPRQANWCSSEESIL